MIDTVVTRRVTEELQRTIPRYEIPHKMPRKGDTLMLKECAALLGVTPSALSYYYPYWPNFPMRKCGQIAVIRPEELKHWLHDTPDGRQFVEIRERLDRWTEPNWEELKCK